MWEQFIARCKSKGTTATATLIQFIELYLDDIDNLDAIDGDNLDKRLDSKIKGASQFGKNKRRNIIREVPSRIMWEFNLVALPLLAQIQN